MIKYKEEKIFNICQLKKEKHEMGNIIFQIEKNKNGLNMIVIL